jgi:uncharacterized protein (AIM24 family)
MLQFVCAHCNYQAKVKDKYRGKKVKCPQCETPVQVSESGFAKQEPPHPSTAQESLKSEPTAEISRASIQSPSSIQKRNRYSLDEFLSETKQQNLNQGLFELERDRILEVNLQDSLWIKTGSMISHSGNIRFIRERILEFGIGKAFKKLFTGEGATLTSAEGQGKVYLADNGKKISLLKLEGETFYVNGNDLLAFEKSLSWDVQFIRQFGAWVSGGLFNIKLSGTGLIAVTTHYDPLTLQVSPGEEIATDPNATVAWSGSLEPKFRTDIQLKTFFGRGSGESIQMTFSGSGFVVVQPVEETPFTTTTTTAQGPSKKGVPPVISLGITGVVILAYIIFAVIF